VATKTAENLSLEIKRLIKAPRERVFDTWTSPDEILEWFGPEGTCQPLSAQVDLRVGGEYRIRAISQACGGPTEVSGVYREVQRPSRLVYTWQWNDPPLNFGETLVTVDFLDLNGATEVRLHQEGFPNVEMRDGHTYGWSASLDKLERLFHSAIRNREVENAPKE
jgi:uncharacterized protein YndB with AHSA1/START domain